MHSLLWNRLLQFVLCKTALESALETSYYLNCSCQASDQNILVFTCMACLKAAVLAAYRFLGQIQGAGDDLENPNWSGTIKPEALPLPS